MIHTVKTVRTLQVIAITVGVALFLWSTGLPSIFLFAEAASITSASDTLSSSAPGALSNHTISFTTPNGMLASSTMTITFPAGFSLPVMGPDDIDIMASGTQKDVATTSSTGGVWGAYFSGQVLTLTSPTDGPQSSSTPFVIWIGTNATTGVTGDAQITNPTATTTSYKIDIGGGATNPMPDSGEVRVAIVDQVTVSANVDTSLSFSVTGVAASSTVNGSATTTGATTTAVALPFGTLSVGTSKTLAHDLTVSTNADSGYSVTVEQTGDLQSTTGATIDGFFDGTNVTTPTAWVAPTAQIANTDTYGHWGITSSDLDTTFRAVEFGTDEWVSASTTPVIIMGNDGPADGLTAGVGTARIGYQIQISALQEAGDDYTTTLRYIVTPTF